MKLVAPKSYNYFTSLNKAVIDYNNQNQILDNKSARLLQTPRIKRTLHEYSKTRKRELEQIAEEDNEE